MGTERIHETPINDFLYALHLLQTPWNGSSVRILIFAPDGSLPCRLRIDYYGAGYTRDLYSDSELYTISPLIAQGLLENRFLLRLDEDSRDGWLLTRSERPHAFMRKQEERWDSETLAFYNKQFREREERAKQFFKPGIHSSWSRVLENPRERWETEDLGNGRERKILSFYYQLPGKEWVRIWENGNVQYGKLPVK